MKLLEKAKIAFKYIVKFKELVAILGFLWLAFVSPLGPDIRITYESQPFRPPFSAIDALPEIPDSNNKSVWADFLGTRSMAVVDIANCRNERIVDFELEILGVEAVSGIAGRTTSSRLDANLTDLLAHSISHKGVLHFPNLTEIPPRAKLWIVIYGSFHETPFGTPIRAHASAEKIKIGQERGLSGFALFIGANARAISVLILVTALLVGLRRIKND